MLPDWQLDPPGDPEYVECPECHREVRYQELEDSACCMDCLWEIDRQLYRKLEKQKDDYNKIPRPDFPDPGDS